MATSNNTSWELTRDQLVIASYKKLAYLAEGQTLSAEALADGVEALNAVITLLETEGMPLWKRTTQVFACSTTSQVYILTAGVKLAQVVLKDVDGGAQYDLIEKSLYDFNRLPSNAGPGTPVHYTYQPTIPTGTLSIWPLLSDSTTVTQKQIVAVYQKKFDGFFAAGETMDFPSYWTQAIIYGTAVALAPQAGTPLQDREVLMKEFLTYKKMAADYGDEDGSLYMQPDFMGLGGFRGK